MGWEYGNAYLTLYVHQTILTLQPPQYKLDPRLARLLGVHTQTRASIMQALWLYIKHNKLQDSHEKEYINCNRYFRQVSTFWLVSLLSLLSFSFHLQDPRHHHYCFSSSEILILSIFGHLVQDREIPGVLFLFFK